MGSTHEFKNYIIHRHSPGDIHWVEFKSLSDDPDLIYCSTLKEAKRIYAWTLEHGGWATIHVGDRIVYERRVNAIARFWYGNAPRRYDKRTANPKPAQVATNLKRL